MAKARTEAITRMDSIVRYCAMLFAAFLVVTVLVQPQNAFGVSTMPSELSLVQLAEKRFGTTGEGALTDPERKLLRAAEEGKTADYQDYIHKDNNDPAKTESWGKERRIRSTVIEWLCTNDQAKSKVAHQGLRAKGALIVGKLDLSNVAIPILLFFDSCSFPRGMYLRAAEIRELYMSGSHVSDINADGIKVYGSVFLRDGFTSTGEVRLLNAEINGTLDCRDGTFRHSANETDALSLDSIIVKGTIFLNDDFTSIGVVRLVNAVVGGNLDCSNGKFYSPPGSNSSIIADRIKVNGSIILSSGFTSHGEVRLPGAEINDDLTCRKGTFNNPWGSKVSITADSIKVKRSIFLNDGFKSNGTVRLLNAEVGGDLSCKNGEFNNENGTVLDCHNIRVFNDFIFLSPSAVTGGIDLTAANITHYFNWEKVDTSGNISLVLTSARIGTLMDEPKSWPPPNKIDLNGLVYDGVANICTVDFTERLRWLRLQDGYNPQPYEQWAATLQRHGFEDAAKDVLIAKNDDLLKHNESDWTSDFKLIAHKCIVSTGLVDAHNNLLKSDELGWWQKIKILTYGHIITNYTLDKDHDLLKSNRLDLWSKTKIWVLKFFIGYGYRPWNSFYMGIGIIILGFFLFRRAYGKQLIQPVKKDWNETDAYPKFNAFMYSVDMFVPVINLFLRDYWLPSARKGRVWSLGRFRFTSGSVLRVYLWFHIFAGWVLTSLFVVGLTGLIKK